MGIISHSNANVGGMDRSSRGLREFMRAFRALGLEKRSGGKMQIDEAMFKSFDTNGDGVVSLAEVPPRGVKLFDRSGVNR